jgi:hypothetical protein
MANLPFVLCLTCLATRLGLTEKTVGDAARIVIGRDGFGVDRRPCYGCKRTTRVLVADKDLR